jgi:hypothetical protein
MATMRKRRRERYPRYAAMYDYTTDKGWSMTDAEAMAISDRADEYEAKGDMAASEREMKKIPLAPNLAWLMRDELGKKAFLEAGYNLKDAEIAYGKNWVDEFNVINDNKGRWNG